MKNSIKSNKYLRNETLRLSLVSTEVTKVLRYFWEKHRRFFNFLGLWYFIRKYLIVALLEFFTQHRLNCSEMDVIILINWSSFIFKYTLDYQ